MTTPLRAILYTDRARHRADATPGSVWFPEHETGGETCLWFYCPCGCGQPSRITIGHGFKPNSYSPTWKWNGSTLKRRSTPRSTSTQTASARAGTAG